jgi:hypothetical protein
MDGDEPGLHKRSTERSVNSMARGAAALERAADGRQKPEEEEVRASRASANATISSHTARPRPIYVQLTLS